MVDESNNELAELAATDVNRILTDLEKYAGWLGRGLEPARVREDVKVLTAVFDSGCNIQKAVDTLEGNIGKVQSWHVGTLLRKALRDLRLAVAEEPHPYPPRGDAHLHDSPSNRSAHLRLLSANRPSAPS
jgi:hypothetical protein